MTVYATIQSPVDELLLVGEETPEACGRDHARLCRGSGTQAVAPGA